MTCIPFHTNHGPAIICMAKTDFTCPACDYQHIEADYYSKLDKSKTGLIRMRCKGCKEWLGITADMKGDIRVWMKSDEKRHASGFIK